MELKNFRFETDADGIALVTWDMPGRSMNVINPEVMAEIGKVVDRISSDAAIKGAVVTLAKGVGGADLTLLQDRAAPNTRAAPRPRARRRRCARLVEVTKQLNLALPPARDLRQAGRDGDQRRSAWAAASNWRSPATTGSPRTATRPGSACRKSRSACSPAAGGTQRVARLMPTPDALQMLFKGDQIKPGAAKKMGLIHEVAPADQIVPLAKAWVKANPNAKAPWDDPKFKPPSGKVFLAAGHDDLAARQRDLSPRNL